MTCHFCLPPLTARALDPDDLRLASAVYETALAAIDRPVPEAFRVFLARLILECLFHGERDADRLNADALKYVRLAFRST
ncbi:hypothetical protein [Microvirga massiliensis]|uniref:hypothetical protein n=1 Tax=Microvirga massiliensis TaxID=1033741 RepID=UPI00065F811F|nr:hypothetical protein [Microvirga massiliensis]